MPISHWRNISCCLEYVRVVQPESVLDIGVGFGRWGILCREFLDICMGRYDRQDWKTKIDGIEIYQKYVKPYHAYFYNQILIGDAYNIIKKMKISYDLMILGDVLEHFEKDRAIELLNICLKKSRYVILNIPLGSGWEQGAVLGNLHETHRSSWRIEELQRFPHKHFKVFFDEASKSFASFLMIGKGGAS